MFSKTNNDIRKNIQYMKGIINEKKFFGKKIGKKIVTLLMAGVLLTSFGAETVNAASASVMWMQNCNTFYRGTITTGTAVVKTKPITETQAQHKKGYDTTISVSHSVSKSATISTDVTFGYDEVVVCTANVGVAMTEEHTVSSSVSYTISKSTPIGRYRIDTVFPGMKVSGKIEKQSVYQQDKSKWTSVASATATFGPNKKASYHKLTRYAD